jgi:uncharacterized membrane protein (DUF4010 family)
MVCLLGALTTLGHRDRGAIGIVTAAVLAYKQRSTASSRGRWDDIYAGLRLLIATFIVLPLLPDQPIDPWGALKPYSLWLLVLLISSLSLVGYVGNRWLGAERGIVLTGLTGGLVSSTAVTLSCARQSADATRRATALQGAAVLLAWCIMFGRVVVRCSCEPRALVSRHSSSRLRGDGRRRGRRGGRSLYWRDVAAVRDGEDGEGAAAPVPLRTHFS